ncbi:MAG: dienelactone hydrolase family protein [Synechococcus sp. ELA619]
MTEPAAMAMGAEWVTIGPAPAGVWDGSSGQAAGPAVPLRCWWARPLGQAPRAAVIVLPEVFGVNDWVRSVADRLAAAGYAALALNTMARTAPDLELRYDAAGLELGRQHRDAVTAAGFLDDLAASVAWIRDQPDLAGLPIGCVGFCFGGHLALLAATLPAIGATCAFYGARVSSFRPGGGPPSLQLVPQIPGRLWCFCGDQDPLIPPEEITAVAAALTAANGGVPAESEAARHRLLVAPGAGHGYMCEARADFSPEAARSGWSAMLGLFASISDELPPHLE